MKDMRHLYEMGCIDEERMKDLEEDYNSGKLETEFKMLEQSNDYSTGKKKKLTKAQKKAKKKARRLT